MKKLRLPCVLLAASALAGCASLNDKQGFAQTVTAANASLASGLSYAERVQLEYRTTYESRLFLSKTPKRAEKKIDCSTDYSREVDIAKNRIAKFKIVDIYFKKIEATLADNIDFTKYVSEFQNASTTIESLPVIRGFDISAEKAFVTAVAGPAARLANQLQTHWDLKLIADVAKKLEKTLPKLVADISSGLVSSQAELNAAVKAWETCEYERLEVIYAHENANPTEVSALFDAYQVKLASLKSQNKIVISAKGSLDAVVEANKKLANPRLTWTEAKSYLDEGSKALKDFKALVEAGEAL